MSQANFENAHRALQGLKSNHPALQRFQEALGGLSAATGLAYDDPTLTYVANTLVNQRHITANANIAKQPGTSAHGGFLIKASVEVA